VTSIALSLIGTISSLVWLSILLRVLYHLHRLESIIALIESDLEIPHDRRLSGASPGRFPARDVMRWSVAVIAAIWAIELFRKLTV
jgi:hypothetical protein